jgi:hypothetical protein
MTLPAPQTRPIDELIEQFRLAVRWHDVTYEYSDDGSCYRKGSQQRSEIERLRALIPDAVACEIWNAHMDAYFIPEEAPHWHWTPKTEGPKNV